MNRTLRTIFFGSMLALSTAACGAADTADSDVDALDEAAPSADEQSAGEARGNPVDQSANHYLVPPDAKAYGHSLGEWGAEWWKWLLGIPYSTSPARSGACDQNQSGQVFFLAGNYGGVSQRACSVPAGKAIFFPIMNGLCLQCPEYGCGQANYDMGACAGALVDKQHPLLLEIDGQVIEDLEDYRAPTGDFLDPETSNPDRLYGQCGGPIRQNSCGVPAGTQRSAAADGYWMMLHPLPAGDHTIHFAAQSTTGFWLDITYTITVEP